MLQESSSQPWVSSRTLRTARVRRGASVYYFTRSEIVKVTIAPLKMIILVALGVTATILSLAWTLGVLGQVWLSERLVQAGPSGIVTVVGACCAVIYGFGLANVRRRPLSHLDGGVGPFRAVKRFRLSEIWAVSLRDGILTFVAAHRKNRIRVGKDDQLSVGELLSAKLAENFVLE